jgi:predicted enzyme related to lactoylglutathione lyase
MPRLNPTVALARDRRKTGVTMRIKLNSIIVEDQSAALAFYTEVLGFIKVLDFPIGEFRWLTVASPEEPDGTQLVLEPNANPAAKVYQAAMFAQGVPLTAFAVEDIQAEYERLTDLGVRFTMEPNDQGMAVFAVFDDTCGNLIQIYQVK